MKTPYKLYSTLLLLALTLNPFLGLEQKNVHAKYIIRPSEQAVFHNNRGVTYLNQSQVQKALFEFKQAVELSPQYTEALSNLGLTYKHLRQYDQAKRTLERAIKIDKKFTAAYNHLGSVYLTQGDYETAIKYFKKAIKVDKRYGDAYYNLGLAYKAYLTFGKKGDWGKKAEEAFRNATAANPRHYLAHTELGNVYSQQNRTELAIFRYKAALEIQPSASGTWKALGHLYLKQGNRSKAEFCFNKAIQAQPGTASNHSNIGFIHIQSGNYKEARRECNNALKMNPQDSSALNCLAVMELKIAENIKNKRGLQRARSQYTRALQYFKRTLKSEPNNINTLYNIAYIHGNLGQMAEAMNFYQKVLRMNSKHSHSLVNLGLIQLKLGQKKNGFKLLCQFLKSNPRDLQSARAKVRQLFKQSKKKCR